MTEKTLTKALLKKGCSEIVVSNDYDEKKTQSEFYGQTILSFKYKGHNVSLCAIGDVIGYVYHLTEDGALVEERVKDKNNHRSLRIILDSIKAICDDDVSFNYEFEMEPEEIKRLLVNHKAVAVLDYSNWFEIFIDKKSEVWENDLSNLDYLISELDDWIDWAEC